MKRISFITIDIVQIVQSYFGHLGFSINKLEEKEKLKGHRHHVIKFAAFDMLGDSYGPIIKTMVKDGRLSLDS